MIVMVGLGLGSGVIGLWFLIMSDLVGFIVRVRIILLLVSGMIEFSWV